MSDAAEGQPSGADDLECHVCGESFPDEETLQRHLYAQGIVD
jgi:hypothetical protein